MKGAYDRSYCIYQEKGLLKKIPGLLKKEKFANRCAVICDSNVARLYGPEFVTALKKAGIKAVLIKLKAGENSKNFHTIEKLLNTLLAKRFTRTDGVIALGGGVTGDIAGFVASIFMRGIPFIQIPTSLLAMVDASIGGKTGINLTYGKNLAGTFYQPKAVFIDTELLKTLPKNEFLNGFAEIIKYGVIADDKLFRILEKNQKYVLSSNHKILNNIIIQCCKIKASIIEKDEKEIDKRMILNYGHTAGHAIEKLSAYKLSHGRSIAMGMRIINKIALIRHMLKKEDVERINNLLNSYDLKDDFRKIFRDKKAPQKLWSIIQNDKKMRSSKINFIIPVSIGKTIICDEITKKTFLQSFE